MKEPKDSVILVVDDEEDLREAIAFDFRRKGFQVLTAASGNEAFRIVENKVVDVVISDVRMPDGDGVALLDRIKAKNPFLPVVMFVTGFADLSLEEAYDKGADAVFAKPFDRKSLFLAVTKALESFETRYQRNGSRVDIELQVGIKFLSSGFALQTKATNIGRGGIFVVLPGESFPKAGESAEFSLQSAHEPPFLVAGRGLVRWVRTKTEPQYAAGCGLEFEWLERESILSIVELINVAKTKSFIPRK